MSNTSNSQSSGQGQSSEQASNPSGDNRQGQGRSTSGKSSSLTGTSQAGAQEAAKTGDSTVDDTLRPGEDRSSGRPFKGDQPGGSQNALGDQLETDMRLGTGGSSKEDGDKREKADPAKEPTAGLSNSWKQGNNPTRPGSTREDQSQGASGDCGCGG